MREAARMAGMDPQQFWRIVQGDVENPGILTVQNMVRSLGGKMRDLFAEGDLEPGGMRPEKEEPPTPKTKGAAPKVKKATPKKSGVG